VSFLTHKGIQKKGKKMAISSIHIQAGQVGYFAHNSRESKTVNSIFDDEKNFCSCSNSEAFGIFKTELQKRTEAFLKNHKQSKLHSKTVTHFSAIVNFNKDHTSEDIQKVCRYLELKFDTKVIQYSMHRDEGHIQEDGTKVKNYHAHIEFIGLDSKGNSIRRKLDRSTLRNLQTSVAKLLKMERGHEYAKEKLPRPRRLDTYEFKSHKKQEAKAVLATQKDLKNEIAKLREELKEQGATRADYAEIEQLNKDLKEQVRTKELTVQQLLQVVENQKSSFSELKEQVRTKDLTIQELQKIIENQIAKIQELSVALENTLKSTEIAIESNNEQKEYICSLESENEELKAYREKKGLFEDTKESKNLFHP
jgi:hypothetical protein